MWPRVVEAMLGIWLVLSPFVLRHPDGATGAWATDLVCGTLVLALALVSFWRPTRHAHFGHLLVVAWLLGYGYLGTPTPAPPSVQNQLVIGMLLAMLAILPDEASQPPRAWRDFHAQRRS